MTRLIRVELLKLRTVRATYGLLAATAVLTAVITTAEAARAGSGSVASLSTAAGLSSVTTSTGWAMLLAAVLGVLISSGEFRHSTATLTYLAAPDRTRVLTAKLIAATGVGAVFGLVAAVVATGIGLAFATSNGDPIALSTAAMVGHGAGATLGSALLAAVGVALGSLIRSQLAGVIGILIWGLVIESIIGGLFTTLRPYLPYTAATTLAGAKLGVGPGGFRVTVHHGTAVAGPLPFTAAAILVAAIAILLAALAARSTVRRDIT
jgi:ABC-type transport system involved in multi-copper enzyme maturation permease subunit